MPDFKLPIAHRFRGYLPVVVDVETAGFNSKTDALLEFAAVTISMNDSGFLEPGERFFHSIEPFEGANIEQSSIEFIGIDPFNPLRMAVPEKKALAEIFKGIRSEIKRTGCTRAIMVAHNAAFDQGFVNEAAERAEIKRNPFHPFSSFDTATLCGLAFGQTVLARACAAAGIDFDTEAAHSARYDCDVTTEIFCNIVNKWEMLQSRGR